MEEMKELKKHERQLRSSIKTIAKFVQDFRREIHEKQIDVRLETLENAMRKFYTVRRKIELIIDEEDEKPDKKESTEQRAERLETLLTQREEEFNEAIRVVEEEYYEIKTALISLRSKSDAPAERSNNASEIVHGSRVKLPDIKLPTFSGKVKDWVTFRDTFRSLIHNNRQLDDVDKFTYLRSSVSGDAFQEINSVGLSADNYEVAWSMLEKRFENKKLIVKAHLDALFAIESMRRESCDSLNYLINEFDKNLQMLAKIGENPTNWSTILAHMVCARLDSVTLQQWETHHNSKEVPKFELLIEFLRDQCMVLQSIAPNKVNADEIRSPRLSVTHTSIQSSKRCLLCGDSFHLAFRCDKFQSMSVRQRVEEVSKKRLCRNCLSAGHFAESCSRGSCNRCGRTHHTLLHYDSGMTASRSVKPFVPQGQGRPHTAVPQPQQTQSKPQGQTQNTISQPSTEQSPTTSYPIVRTMFPNTHPQPTPAQHITTTLKSVARASPRQVLLSTAIVRVKDRFGNTMFARTLLDSCSEYCE